MKTVMSLLLGALVFLGSCGQGQSEPAPKQEGSKPANSESWQSAARKARKRGVLWLEKHAQKGLFSFGPGQPPSVGITALALLGILRGAGAAAQASHLPALGWLASQQQPDGSIQQGQLATYSTALALLALEASGEDRFAPTIKKGMEYLRQVQLDEEEGYQRSSEYYGGIGYEKKKNDPQKPNPNLSTTSWALEAAHGAGLPADDPFFKKSLVFLERIQNRSESNDQVHKLAGLRVLPSNDGGAFYQPWFSKAGIQETGPGKGAFRSYGSMSYALLKCYLFCRLDPHDPRVRAVIGWLKQHWKVDRNPGMEHLPQEDAPYMGLFYYWVTLGRSLAAAEERGQDFLGTPLAHWRRDVALAVMGEQRGDGSWVNRKSSRWWEKSPVLVTAYGVLCLSDCLGE